MSVTASQQLVRDTAQASFWQSYETSPDIMEGIFQRVDSESDQETYPGLAYAPRPREMTGGRDHRSVPSFSLPLIPPSSIFTDSTLESSRLVRNSL